MNIVITGASKGFGKAIAKKFAEDNQGHTLLLCARNKELLDNESKLMQGRFPWATFKTRKCDVSIRGDLNNFAEWVLGEVDKIDVLVNNAGQFLPGSVHNEEEGVLEKMIEVNLYSAYHLTRLLIPKMIEQKNGHIFNICSIASLQAYNNGGSYSISKFALSGFSKNLREEMKPHGIRVTTVYPGASFTDSWSESGIDRSRFMEAADIASMIYSVAQLSEKACVEEIILRPQGGDL